MKIKTEAVGSNMKLPTSAIDRLNSRISNVSAYANQRINNVEAEMETKATEERVDGIDEVIENILEDIIPSIIEGEPSDDYMEDDEQKERGRHDGNLYRAEN